MRFAEDHDQGPFRIPFHQTSDMARHTQVASADAAHIVSWMAIDAVDGNTQFARGGKDRFVSIPFAAPLFVVTDPVEKFLFRDFTGHPFIKNRLMAREERLDGDGDVVLFLCGQLADKLPRIRLAAGERVVYVGGED